MTEAPIVSKTDRCIAVPIRRRAMITVQVAAESEPATVAFDDQYPGGPSTQRSIGMAQPGRYVVDLGLNAYRERRVVVAVTSGGAPADLSQDGEAIIASQAGRTLAAIQFRDG